MNFKSIHKQTVFTLFLFIVLFLPALVVLIGNNELDGLIFKKFGYFIVYSICILLPALFLKKKVYFCLEGIINLFVAPIEIASIYLNHETTNFMIMDTILCTNFHEATELLSSLWMVVGLVFLLWVVYFLITFRCINNDSFFPAKLRNSFLIAIPIVFVVGCTYFFILARNLMTSESTSWKDNIVDVSDMMISKFNKIFPFDVYIATNEVLQHHAQLEEDQKRLQNFTFGIEPSNDDKEEICLLVIGETARWKSFGLNGYSRNTTPYLSQQKNLISYSHCVTMANLTSNSLPLIITRANGSHPDIAHQEKSVCEAFAEAGFETSWISDQDFSTYLNRIIQTCDNQILLGKKRQKYYDMDLIAPLDSILQNSSNKKKFIVIHTMGSHFKYNQRYPNEFNHFTPCFESSMDLMAITPDNANLLINAYDNSILYTDYFLSNLIKTVEKKGGIWSLLFLSDHGENIFDDERNLIMHGTLVVTQYEAHIPFFVVFSDDYKQQYPDKVLNILQNQSKNISSEVVFHSLLDLANISSTIINDSLCIGRPILKSFDSTYILNGNRTPILFDFDTLENHSAH